MTRIRVVHFLDGMGVGGTEMNAVRTLERLDRSRFDLSLVVNRPEGPLRERFQQLGIPIRPLGLRSLYAPGSFYELWRLGRWFRSEGVQVVHAHDLYSNYIAAVAGRLAGHPAVIASKRWHFATRPHRLVSAVAFRLATRVLANSGGVVRSLREEDRIRETKIELIPNFADANAFVPPTPEQLRGWRQLADVAEGDLVAGIIASLRPIKNQFMAIRAIAMLAAEFPRLRLVLVGDGESRGPLQQLATELGVADRLRMVGIQPQQPSWHYLFDVSMLTSHSEGFPNSVLEGMAAGRPILSTRVGGVTDIVEHGVQGFIVDGDDSASLARELRSLLEDPDLRARMGAAARAVASTRYSEDRVIGQVEALYTRLARRI